MPKQSSGQSKQSPINREKVNEAFGKLFPLMTALSQREKRETLAMLERVFNLSKVGPTPANERVRQEKSTWKKKWEESRPYIDWQKAIKSQDKTKEEIQQLKDAAFRERDEIRKETGSQSDAQSQGGSSTKEDEKKETETADG